MAGTLAIEGGNPGRAYAVPCQRPFSLWFDAPEVKSVFVFFHPFLNNVWLAQECECALFTYTEVSPGNLYSHKNIFYLSVF